MSSPPNRPTQSNDAPASTHAKQNNLSEPNTTTDETHTNNNNNNNIVVVPYHTPFAMDGETCIEAGHCYRLGGRVEAFRFRCYADALEGFTLRHQSSDVLVWDRKLPNDSTQMLKVFTVFRGATPAELFDMLHDAVFRETWDQLRLDAFRITRLNPCNDIGYYAAQSPVPFVAPRDFVNQRVWHSAGRGEYVIFNTSVPHPAVPVGFHRTSTAHYSLHSHGSPTPNPSNNDHNLNNNNSSSSPNRTSAGPNKASREKFVRGVSKISGYFIQPWRNPQTGVEEGVAFTYLTQVDLRGSIPKALLNYVSTKFAPKTVRNVAKAVARFQTWLPAQLAAGTYRKDWEQPPEWWISPEEEAVNPVQSLTLDFAREKWKGGPH